MNSRVFDWIWHIRGSLPLTPAQSSEEAFERLDPLFREPGTSHERTNDTLTFRKKDQLAQDKMSIFDGGVLEIEKGAAGPVLRYDLSSRALLFCFLAPLLFLGFAQATIYIGQVERAAAEAKDKKEEEKKEDVVLPQNPIDKFLGSPAPEKPKKDEKSKKEEEEKKHSPTSAYVFAALFAALYVVGRIFEDRLARSLFRKRLLGT